MDCSQVRELLSPYYDGALSADDRAVVAEHLSHCPACEVELEAFRRLSALVHSVAPAPPPDDRWSELARRLEENTLGRPKPHRRRRVFGLAALAAAATALIAVGMFGHRGGMDGHDAQMTAHFGDYMAMFERNPSAAQNFLASSFAHQPLDHDRQSGGIAAALPASYTLHSAQVWDMPCCPCVQIVCQRPDGSLLAIFEHEEPQPMWFAGRSTMQKDCGGKSCTLVVMEGQLAATWRAADRQITVVGARDVAEVSELVQWLSGS